MARLLDDLLDVSRLSRGTLTLQRAPVSLRSVVEHAMESTAPLLESQGQRLITDGLDVPLLLEADSARLVQVVGNLLNNAAKFGEPGSAIHLSVRREGDQAVIAVRDEGAGIPPEQIDQVFELFAQVDAPRDRAKGGLGIGLSLAKRLVAMHGGSIQAFSAGLGHGSTFTVRLPLLAAATGHDSTGEPIRVAAPESPVRRILVVDDNEDAADMLSVLLQQLGCEVRVAYDGQSAVAALDGFRADLVLLDIGMPGMDGYETCRRLRRHPLADGLAVVALTGWGQEQHRARSAAAGFDLHLVKPVDAEALSRLLLEWPARAGRGPAPGARKIESGSQACVQESDRSRAPHEGDEKRQPEALPRAESQEFRMSRGLCTKDEKV
jgi:two-component system CheB/CheR fusion protein